MMAWWNLFSSDACEPGGIVNGLSQLDYVTQAIGVIRDLFEGGVVFHIPDNYCLSRKDVKRIMKRNDIEAWGFAWRSDGFCIFCARL